MAFDCAVESLRYIKELSHMTSHEHLQEILDKLWELGVPHVVFTGGEATLRNDLPELIAHAEANGQITGLNTNARRLADEKYVAQLVEAGLDHVQITVESCEGGIHDEMMRSKGAFKQTINGLKNVLNSSLYVMTNTTMLRTNVDTIPNTLDFLANIGVPTIGLNALIYSGNGLTVGTGLAERELQPILDIAIQKTEVRGQKLIWYTPTQYCEFDPTQQNLGVKGCTAALYSMCIESNGDVLPCQSYYVSAGNILRDPWEQIWDGELFRSFRDRELDPRWAGLPEKCWDCPDLPLCGGGCRIEREARDGHRVAEGAGGGCSGCSGACGTAHTANPVATAGYIPTAGMVKTGVRATGDTPGFIPLADLDYAPVPNTQPVNHLPHDTIDLGLRPKSR